MFDFKNIWHKELTTRDTPKAERKKLEVGDIWTNAARCLGCGDVIESWATHDFVTCRCGDLSVDSGSHDERRVYSGVYEDRIELYDDAEAEELQDAKVVQLCEWLERVIDSLNNVEPCSFLFGIRASAVHFADDTGHATLLGHHGATLDQLNRAIALVQRRRAANDGGDL